MKNARRRSTNVIDMPQSQAAERSASAAQVSNDQIAQRAFELYCARGCEDGRDLDDWLQAERDLRGDASSSAA